MGVTLIYIHFYLAITFGITSRTYWPRKSLLKGNGDYIKIRA